MSTTEERLREALADYDTATPDLTDLTTGIATGIRRQRRKRQYAMVGTTIATVAVVALAVPFSMGIVRDHPHPAQKAQAASLPRLTTLTTKIDYAPKWLPARSVESERVINEHDGATARVFTGSARVKIADWSTPDKLLGHTTSSKINGKNATGFETDGGYEVQLPWRSGRWLKVIVTQAKKPSAIALQVARSVHTVAPVGIDALPTSCTIPSCAGRPIVSVLGKAQAWQVIIDQGSVEVVVSHAYLGAAIPDQSWTKTVHGSQAQLANGQLQVDLGGAQTLIVRGPDSKPVPDEQLLQAANSALPLRATTYEWLGTKP